MALSRTRLSGAARANCPRSTSNESSTNLRGQNRPRSLAFHRREGLDLLPRAFGLFAPGKSTFPPHRPWKICALCSKATSQTAKMQLTPLQWKLSAICKFTEKLCFASNVEIILAASDLRFPLMSCAKSQDEHSTSIESAKAQFLPIDFFNEYSFKTVEAYQILTWSRDLSPP